MEGNPKFKPDLLCLVRLYDDFSLKDIVLLTREEINNPQFSHNVTRRVKFNSELKSLVYHNKLGKRFTS